MRRQDLQLLNRARSGDAASRCELARRYLMGDEGFARSREQAMHYLQLSLVRDELQAHMVLADGLALHELLEHGHMVSLERAARAGSPGSQCKLALWLSLTERSPLAGRYWYDMAARSGHPEAESALSLVDASTQAQLDLLRLHTRSQPSHAVAIAREAVLHLAQGKDTAALQRATATMIDAAPTMTPLVADTVLRVIEHARAQAYWPQPACVDPFEASLEDCAARGSVEAARILGLAYCGIEDGALSPQSITSHRNLRKGAALLLRAADGGLADVWHVLYRIHADNRSSVANPQMARFFLEKSATTGDADAQRRLGTLILRAASTLHESEQALHWLHCAAAQGDAAARDVMRTLILPVDGDDEAAGAAIEAIMRDSPALACRLRTARDFGLTRVEALCVDLMAGVRPWGLVVGENRYLAQARLAQPRAIPALDDGVHQRLRRSAAYFEQARLDRTVSEGDLRGRSARLRRLLSSYGLEESMFFARASSQQLDKLRHGPKWAFVARDVLLQAVGD